MSRHRESIPPSVATESFNLRWHSIANQATPSADIMSSPDPLNEDDTTAIVPPSSSRVTRSQRSTRFDSLAISPRRATSPRKQTFELEVGNNKSPQRLLVTVETEDGEHMLGNTMTTGTGTRRRLFHSPSPFDVSRRGVNATTTTVPLKDSIEEESIDGRMDPSATPKRRGRPRKTNGTPVPSAMKKRKAGTPIKQRTPRRQNTSHLPDPLSDPVTESTPTPRKRGRPRKNPSAVPSSDAGVDSTTKGAASQRRRRRQALAPNELVETDKRVDSVEPVALLPVPSDDEMELVGVTIGAHGVEIEDELREVAPPSPPQDAGSDIWMATMSAETTPRARTRTTTLPAVTLPSAHSRRSESADLASVASDADDYGAGVPSIGDASEGELADDAGPSRDNDTVAQGEDFSMIFMDSIQSFQAFKSSVPGPPPALQEEELGEETSLILSKTLESFRQSRMTDVDEAERRGDATEVADTHDDSGPRETSVPVQEQTAAQSEMPSSPIRQSPEQDVEHIDLVAGYSSSEEVVEEEPAQVEPYTAPEEEEPALQAAAPSVEPPSASPRNFLSSRWLRSPRKADVSPLRQRLVQSQFRQADTVLKPIDNGSDREGSPSSRSPAGRRVSGRLDEHDYEDSFSEIPQDVLEGATPRRPGQVMAIPEENDDEGEGDLIDLEDEMEQVPFVEDEDEEEAEEDQPQNDSIQEASHHTAASNASSIAQTDNGRLPTPDDTPPNIEGQAEDSPDKGTTVSVSLASSPPEPLAQLESEHDAALLVAGHSEQRITTTTEGTPLNQVSSPAQEPQSIVVESVQKSAQDKAARPALSAILRAGRALQTITSDPPSPETREYQLRSPFRSSASKDSRSGSREAPQTGRRLSLSPARRPVVHRRQSASVGGQHGEDPFVSTSKNTTGQSSFMKALDRSIHEAIDKSRASSQSSAASSMRITPPDDEMSWVANEGPISPRLRGDNSLQDVTGAPTSGAPIASQQLPPAVTEEEEEEEEEQSGHEESRHEGSHRGDDETDIWEIEAERSLLQSSTQQAPVAQSTSHLHRRGQIPSPWTRNTKTAVTERRDAGDAASSDQPENVTTKQIQAVEPEEYSILEQRQQDKDAQNAASAQKGTRFDLSSFFSSPNAIPGRPMEKTQAIPASRALPVVNEPIAVQAAPEIQTSTMFPSVPQKEFRPRTNSRSSLFSPAKAREVEKEAQIARSASPETPEQLQMPTVAQKKNFTPRPRQTNQSYNPPSATSVAPTPPRMQLSHADIQRWQQQTSDTSEQNLQGRLRPLLRPLPGRNASPTKSSLRSPLKGRTPGRVVEFTSSVLSPADQARARHDRRLSVGSGVQAIDALSDAQTDAVEDHSKENQDSDVSMTDASPLPEAAKKATLSQTTWSRQHWLLMDNIIKHRQANEFDFDFPRRADKYLGKTVQGKGEALVLERWHLDCVDAFRDIVGGWNEGVLAKRVFSLLTAADRRKRRAGTGTQRPSGGMFH